MSARLYSTGLWFYGGRGRGLAKVHEVEDDLDSPPSLIGGTVEQIEYVPEVGVRRVQTRFNGWRDMESDEVRACDAWLARMAAKDRRSS